MGATRITRVVKAYSALIYAEDANDAERVATVETAKGSLEEQYRFGVQLILTEIWLFFGKVPER